MVWWLIFGGIALFAIVLYALLGRMIWRKTKALFQEVERAAAELEPIMDRVDAAQTGEPPDETADPSAGSPDERSTISRQPTR